MEKDGLSFAVNMTDYSKKIENYSFEELQAEKQKILDKQNLNYIYAGFDSFEIHRLNIQDSPDEKNRIYVRKKIALLTKIISAKLNQYVVNFASYWKEINNEFLETTSSPDYVTAVLEGKEVAFADKLNLKGLVAYKRYLGFLCDNLNKYQSFKMAVNDALNAEIEVDESFDREKFFTRFFLPNSIDTIYKNLVKEKCLNNRIKQLGNLKHAETAEMKQ